MSQEPGEVGAEVPVLQLEKQRHEGLTVRCPGNTHVLLRNDNRKRAADSVLPESKRGLEGPREGSVQSHFKEALCEPGFEK